MFFDEMLKEKAFRIRKLEKELERTIEVLNATQNDKKFWMDKFESLKLQSEALAGALDDLLEERPYNADGLNEEQDARINATEVLAAYRKEQGK